jgi:hypothetical protein
VPEPRWCHVAGTTLCIARCGTLDEPHELGLDAGLLQIVDGAAVVGRVGNSFIGSASATQHILKLRDQGRTES